MGLGRPAMRERSVLARLEHFCDEEGLPIATLRHEVMAAFVDKGLSSRTPSTRGTYRSVLRQVAGPSGVRAGTPFSASPAPAPYGSEERSERLGHGHGPTQTLAAPQRLDVDGSRHRCRTALR
jgi:hypothetical protein